MGKGLQYMTSPSGAMKGSSIHVAGWGTFGAWTWETVLKWDPQDKQVGLQLGYITFAIVFVNMFPFISMPGVYVYIYTYICIVSLDYIILDLVWFDMLYIYMHLIHIIWSTWSPWINPATCSVSFRATASAGLRSPALVDEFLVGFRWDVDRNSCAFMGFAVDGIYIDYVGFHVFSWNLDGV